MEAIKEEFGTSTAFGEFTTQEKQSILALFNPPNEFVSVLSEGKPRWFTVEDPLLYRALTNMRQHESRNNPVWKFFRGARQLLTKSVTIMPDFMLRNFLRDTLHTWTIEHDSGFKPLWDSIRQIKNVYNMDEDTRQLMAAGGLFMGNGYKLTNSTEDARKALDAILDQYRKNKDQFHSSLLNTPQKLSRFMGKLFDKYEKVGSTSENSTRVAVYKKLRDKGYTHAEAAFAAKNLMDFTMHGEWEVIRLLTETVPFLGARLTGLHRLGQGALEKPFGFAFKGLTIATASIALYALNQLYNKDDWDELEDWDRDSYFHFWIGSEHFRLPKTFEVGFVFGTIPERLAEQMMTDESGKKFVNRIAAGVLEQLSFDPTPQALKPIVEQIAN